MDGGTTASSCEFGWDVCSSLGTGEGRVLHVVAVDDDSQDETIVITSYEPDPREWESDFRTRKGR